MNPKGLHTPSESEKDQKNNRERSKKKIQTPKEIFAFAFALCEWALTVQTFQTPVSSWTTWGRRGTRPSCVPSWWVHPCGWGRRGRTAAPAPAPASREEADPWNQSESDRWFPGTSAATPRSLNWSSGSLEWLCPTNRKATYVTETIQLRATVGLISTRSDALEHCSHDSWPSTVCRCACRPAFFVSRFWAT